MGLTLDMHGAGRPYFLWDEELTNDELRAILADPTHPRHDPLLAKTLREARDIDVWAFTTPAAVARALPRLERRLGRRYAFWRFLIDGWREYGLLDV